MENNNLKIINQNKTQERANELLNEHFNKIHTRTDKLFGILLIIQWLFAILLALFISPKTWEGTYNQPHIHIWTAIFLGGFIVSFPSFLIYKLPGKPITRHVIAIAQTLTSTLFIHLTGGRIETHFHVFGSLAFLAFYRDWKVLLSGSLVVAIDHFVRGMFWPQSVYGVISIEPWRWLEHAGWVVFEDIFLIISIFQSKKEMHEIAQKQATVEIINKEIEQIVTERTQELKDTQVQLLQASKLSAMGELAAGIAHELTQPLFGIKGFATLLQDKVSKSDTEQNGNLLISQEEILNDLQIILTQTDRMSKLISNVRNFSKNNLTDFSLNNLNKTAEDSFALFSEMLKSKKINTTINLTNEITEIYCNPNQLQQLFINLISNSYDAIEEKRNNNQLFIGEIKLNSNITNDKRFIRLEFYDNGIGMSKKTQEKLFEAFYSTKKNEKGVGLGMSIVSKIINSHNGFINVISTEGIGTTITIQLPLTNQNIKETIKEKVVKG